MSRSAELSVKDVPRVFREMRERAYGPSPHSEYAASKDSRFRRKRKGLGGSGDSHYTSDLGFEKMREYARAMVRDDAIVGTMIDMAVTQQHQTGFRLRPTTSDAKLNEDLLARFVDWAGDPQQCDYASERTFWAQVHTRHFQTYMDGDILAIFHDNGSIQTIEGDRLQRPRNMRRKDVVHGIRLNDRRQKVQYLLTKDPGQERAIKVGDMTPIDAYFENGDPRVLHLYNPKTVRRVTQTRGVTALAPVFDRLGMFEDIQFAKLVQQQVVSAIALFIARNEKYKAGGPGVQFGPQTDDGSNTSQLEKMVPGLIAKGAVGEEAKILSPNIPNAEYFQHVKLILTEVGLALGLPLVMVLMDGSETNFSGWRGAVDMARMGFRVGQKMMREREHRYVYKWQVRRWLDQPAKLGGLGTAARRLNRKGKLFRHTWTPPAWPYIQPLQDTQTDILRLASLQASPSMVQADRGRDFKDVYTETVNDMGDAIQAAIIRARAINTGLEAGEAPVHWRELLNLHLGENLGRVILQSGVGASQGGGENDGQQQGGANNAGT